MAARGLVRVVPGVAASVSSARLTEPIMIVFLLRRRAPGPHDRAAS